MKKDDTIKLEDLLAVALTGKHRDIGKIETANSLETARELFSGLRKTVGIFSQLTADTWVVYLEALVDHDIDTDELFNEYLEYLMAQVYYSEELDMVTKAINEYNVEKLN